jgi:diguanylate cyclase (GGDEF)-like protein/PAS domain S-box-containing protein
MHDQALTDCSQHEQVLRNEVKRLNKVIQALMDRAERSTSGQGSDFSLFQTSIMLEEQVRSRTVELEETLRENEKINRALAESEARFRGVVSQSLVGIYIIEDGKYSYSNARFNEMFGHSADEVRTLGLLEIATEDDRPLVAENIRKRLCGEVDRVDYVFRGIRKNGSLIDVEIHSTAMQVGSRLALIGVVMDITDRRRAEHEMQALQHKLREQSTHDALTGLYNRHYLEETLSREIISANRRGETVSVVMGDLDHFKAINDQFGHPGGDEVLRVFGDLTKQYVRANDICCRYGGEEFLMVLPQTPKHLAVERAQLLCAALATVPVTYGCFAIAVTASFGVATSPCDGRTSGQLIAAADAAMYAAKAAGRNRVNAAPGRIERFTGATVCPT